MNKGGASEPREVGKDARVALVCSCTYRELLVSYVHNLFDDVQQEVLRRPIFAFGLVCPHSAAVVKVGIGRRVQGTNIY